MKKTAFTLQEVLITVIIAGIVAILTVPSLISSVRGDTNGLQLKNIATFVQDAVVQQMIKSHTKNIRNTVFYTPAELLKGDAGIFETTKYCAASSAASGCWKSTSYKTISGSNYSGNFNVDTAILKNGALLGVSVNEETGEVMFITDVNGPKKPNIVGLDLFAFAITTHSNGRITDLSNGASKGELLSNCKSGAPTACFGLVRGSDWKIDYD